MTNKERLQKNNLDLAECLSLATNLPEGASGKPIEIDTLDNSLLTAENDGKVYKCDDKLYQVEKIKSLKGLTIKFNEHITPCPVISEDDVFECSGVFFEESFSVYPSMENVIVTTMCRKLNPEYHPSGLPAYSIVFEAQGSCRYWGYYRQEYNAWHFIDENGNELETSITITNFDCPTLNENPEFIEWVFANAKVYSKIECLNDIKAFSLNFKTMDDYNYFTYAYYYSAEEIFNDYPDITGQFTVSFSMGGEVVTKTFANLGGVVDGEARFYNSDNDVLTIHHTGAINYNGVVIEDKLTFTKFDCIFNDSYYFLSYVLTHAELIDMEYINGYKFVEYEIAVPEYAGTISMGESVEIISFTITTADGTPVGVYYADKGMTWVEWIGSGYNPGNYIIVDYGSIYDADINVFIEGNSVDEPQAMAGDEIVNGSVYKRGW